MEKMKKHKRWTQEDLKWVKSNYKKMLYKEIGMNLGRSEVSIKVIIINKGWAKPKPKWSNKQVQLLKKYYKNMDIDKLSKILGRTKDGIICKIRRLKSSRKQ